MTELTIQDWQIAFLTMTIVNFITLIATGIVIHHQRKEIDVLRKKEYETK